MHCYINRWTHGAAHRHGRSGRDQRGTEDKMRASYAVGLEVLEADQDSMRDVDGQAHIT